MACETLLYAVKKGLSAMGSFAKISVRKAD